MSQLEQGAAIATMQHGLVYDYSERFVHLHACCQSPFTGKERDAESGLDYFGARYYGSNIGRFFSPDWAAKAEPVPYAKLDNPQSLNLYSYVLNNPLVNLDPTGHDIRLGNEDEKSRNQVVSLLLQNLKASERSSFTVTKDSDGKFKLVTKEGANLSGNHSKAFGLLTAAIANSHTVTVQLGLTVDRPETGLPMSVSAEAGGGVTADDGKGNSLVTLSPLGNTNYWGHWGELRGNNGTWISDPKSIIAVHEVFGHALDFMQGGNGSERHAIQVENEIRRERGLEQRP